MAKKEKKTKEPKKEEPKVLEEVVIETGKEPKGDRKKRWDDFLKKYQIQNPEKYDAKKTNGDFDKIPDTFK